MDPHCLWHAVLWNLDICHTQHSPVHRVQTHGASNRDTHLYSPHNISSVHLTTTTYVRRSERITSDMRRGRTTPQDSAFSSPTPAPTPGMTLLTLFSLLARNLGVYVFRKIIRRHCFTVYTCYRPVQPRSYVLRFEGHNIFLGGNIFVLLHVRTNYFINFQRLTGQHIASCLFSV